MVHTRGATRNPAAAADAASAPPRKPRLCVFHFETFSGPNGLLTAGRRRDSGTAIKDDVTTGLPLAASLLLRVSSCIGIGEESTRVASRSFDRLTRLSRGVPSQLQRQMHSLVYLFWTRRSVIRLSRRASGFQKTKAHRKRNPPLNLIIFVIPPFLEYLRQNLVEC